MRSRKLLLLLFRLARPELHDDMRHDFLLRLFHGISGGPDFSHCTVWPPSITMAWPTMNAAPSEHSQTTAAAISSGLPIRPAGSSAITLARPSAVPPVKRSIIGVSMYPGQMALMRRLDRKSVV